MFTGFINKMYNLFILIFSLIGLMNVMIGDVWAEMDIPFSPIPNSKVYRRIMSWREIRDEGIVKQKYDYSCGSGALATLMNIGFDEMVSEEEIIELILKDKYPHEIEEIRTKGYSLLELKKVAEEKGYKTAMVRLQLNQLRQLHGPVLIYFEPDGKRHFSVLKEVKGDRVYLADPAKGNIRLGIYLFKKEWQGVVLAIDKK